MLKADDAALLWYSCQLNLILCVFFDAAKIRWKGPEDRR